MRRVRDERTLVDDVPATAPEQIASRKAYGGSTRPMRPEHIYASWVRENDGDWQLQELTVKGSLIKRNGEVGIAAAEAQYQRWGRSEMDIPAWLRTAINSAQPN